MRRKRTVFGTVRLARPEAILEGDKVVRVPSATLVDEGKTVGVLIVVVPAPGRAPLRPRRARLPARHAQPALRA